MSRSIKLSAALVAVAAAIILVVGLISNGDESASTDTEQLLRPDSQRLTDGTDAVFVEFLDFECEACGGIYPAIEQLEDIYGDRVAFVVRYMPLHTSSINAARAAEAAAQQGAFADMYDLLFQRQTDWGHQDSPEEDVFFDYADELGLDMDQFRADYDDPATLARIEQSKADGRALGVTGTPTMFLDGERLEPESFEDLVAAFDAALAD